MCHNHTFFVRNSKGKLLSTEFTNLKLDTEDGKEEEPYHCENCIHIFRGIAEKDYIWNDFDLHKSNICS